MEIGEMLYVHEREDWRDWLQANYRDKQEIWLVLYKKAAAKPSLPYNDAVEEALCFGWIDSIVKSLDDERRVQRYSPRKPGSGYSQYNKERLKRLVASGVVASDVLPEVAAVAREEFVWPEDIMAALQADPVTWANFQRYSPAYQRIRVAFVDIARPRPDEFDKRLAYLLKMTAQDKQYGFGIESFY